VIVAMSKTPEKPCFEGVRIEAGETLRMVASDGWRIAIREVPWQRCGVDDVPPVLFPPAVLEAMARAVPAGSKVTYCTGPDEGGQGMAGFSCDGQTLVTRTLVSPYPEYGGWVSAERPCFADMDSQALLGAVRRASLMMAPGSGVRLTFYETSASAEAANADAASATETFEVTFSGDEPLKVVLNPEYLKDAVSTVDRDRVRMSFPVAERNSVKLTAPGDGEAADCHLVVPIKVPQPGQ
jgi:DNA polymerase III subunit beta